MDMEHLQGSKIKKGMEDLGKGLNLDEVWHFSSQD
jgi:hypothetical protein